LGKDPYLDFEMVCMYQKEKKKRTGYDRTGYDRTGYDRTGYDRTE
jgi:hypothetical protein